jgi:hypothetical protein
MHVALQEKNAGREELFFHRPTSPDSGRFRPIIA